MTYPHTPADDATNQPSEEEGRELEARALEVARETQPTPPDVPAIYGQLWEIKRRLHAIPKNQQVQAGRRNYAFRGIDQVQQALSPILAEVGVLVLPVAQQAAHETLAVETKYGKRLTILSTLHARYQLLSLLDGSSVEISSVAHGTDDGDKGLSSASSTAYKYALLEAFCIPTEDQRDNDQREAQRGGSEAASPPADHPDQLEAYGEVIEKLRGRYGDAPAEKKEAVVRELWGVDPGALRGLSAGALRAGLAKLAASLPE